MGLGLECAGGAARRQRRGRRNARSDAAALTIERDGVIVDPARDGRRLPFTIWAPGHAGRYPLVLYSHASFGHRRQSSSLTSHLAAHGYVVAAVNHTGNTAADLAARGDRTRSPEELDAYVRQIIADRVPDLRF
ncbi:MAG TPA: hypothetical protein VF001_07185, partial [Candidatus Limnocylindria bacterium]